MTDKVQKIREEVERRMNCFKNERNTLLKASDNNLSLGARIAMCEEILSFIDSLQKEPAPNIFEDMLSAKTAAESLGISAEEHDKIIDLCLYGKEPELVDIDDLPKEEPVSENLNEAAKHYLYSNILYDDVYVGNPTDEDCIEMFKAGAEWQKRRIVKEIKSRLVDAATNQDNSADIGKQTYYHGMVDALGRLRDKFMEN